MLRVVHTRQWPVVSCALLIALAAQYPQCMHSIRKITETVEECTLAGEESMIPEPAEHGELAVGLLEKYRINDTAALAEEADGAPPIEVCTSGHEWAHISDVVANLGKGAFGRVCRVKFKAPPCEEAWNVALKVQEVGGKSPISHEKAHGEIMIQALAARTSGLTVAVYQSFTKGNRNFAMIELGGGDLQGMIRRWPDGMANVDEGKLVRLIFAQLVLAVKQLHEKDIVLSDIKPPNVIINLPECVTVRTAREWVQRKCAVKMADYGISCMEVIPRDMRGAAVDCRGMAGTPVYLPPEAGLNIPLLGNLIQSLGLARGRTKSFDIWALGAMLYEMLFGKPMFLSGGGVDGWGIHILPAALNCQGTEGMPFKDEYEDACERMIATSGGILNSRATAEELFATNYVHYGVAMAEAVEGVQSQLFGHGKQTPECIKNPQNFKDAPQPSAAASATRPTAANSGVQQQNTQKSPQQRQQRGLQRPTAAR